MVAKLTYTFVLAQSLSEQDKSIGTFRFYWNATAGGL